MKKLNFPLFGAKPRLASSFHCQIFQNFTNQFQKTNFMRSNENLQRCYSEVLTDLKNLLEAAE